MHEAESELRAGYEEAVARERRRRGPLELLRQAVLGASGAAASSAEVGRARAAEAEQAAAEPPSL